MITINYVSGKYGVTVNGVALADASGSSEFCLASSQTSAQSVDFAGSGTLTAMKGEQVDGNMASVGGSKYATVGDAIQHAGPNDTVTLLHEASDSSIPSGWKKVGDGFGQLVRVIAGFFMMVL